jgi:hypothetical protein
MFDAGGEPSALVGRLLARGALPGRRLRVRPPVIPLVPTYPGRLRGELLQPLQSVFHLGPEGPQVHPIAVQCEGLGLQAFHLNIPAVPCHFCYTQRSPRRRHTSLPRARRGWPWVDRQEGRSWLGRMIGPHP